MWIFQNMLELERFLELHNRGGEADKAHRSGTSFGNQHEVRLFAGAVRIARRGRFH